MIVLEILHQLFIFQFFTAIFLLSFLVLLLISLVLFSIPAPIFLILFSIHVLVSLILLSIHAIVSIVSLFVPSLFLFKVNCHNSTICKDHIPKYHLCLVLAHLLKLQLDIQIYNEYIISQETTKIIFQSLLFMIFLMKQFQMFLR